MQVESYSKVTLQKKTLEPMQSFEQGSSAFQMTAAKVMDVIAKLLEMEDAARLLRILKSGCPDKWIRFPQIVVKH